jgi:hypothetical protein
MDPSSKFDPLRQAVVCDQKARTIKKSRVPLVGVPYQGWDKRGGPADPSHWDEAAEEVNSRAH